MCTVKFEKYWARKQGPDPQIFTHLKVLGLLNQENNGLNLSSIITGCEMSTKSLNLPDSQFPHLKKGQK